MNKDKDAQNLIDFIDASPTAFHAVDNITKQLEQLQYQKLQETDKWNLEKGNNYFVTRADSSVIIVKTPKKITQNSSFKIVGAHTDSPCLKVKSAPTSTREGYQLLNIEVYGGVLLSSWFDKDLKIGGRVYLEDNKGELNSELITLPFKVRIPRLAIHLDRNVNQEGFKINAQSQMFPIIGLDDTVNFEETILRALSQQGKIMSWDLFLFDAEKSSFGGIHNEFVFAPRLDNLAMTHASFDAISQQESHEQDFLIAAYFHNEEVGSNTQNGADSNFLEVTLKRISNVFSINEEQHFELLAKSFFISADMAHAVHPSYPEKHDASHKPLINKGPVIKSNANMRYATDGFSVAKFKQWCNRANVPFQDFCNRNDMGCGSTIGPMTAAKLGIPTIDIGNAMLSMHSIREMAGSKDHGMVINVFSTFYKG